MVRRSGIQRRMFKCYPSLSFLSSFTHSAGQLLISLLPSSINYDPSNPVLYTNRAMALLKLHNYLKVVDDSVHAISLLEYKESMKAHFQLAQAQVALQHQGEALKNAKIAHELCVEEIHKGGKGASSIGPITELVLRCKKEDWERREEERLKRRGGLLVELEEDFEHKKRHEVRELQEKSPGGIVDEADLMQLEKKYADKVAELRRTFEAANLNGSEAKRRQVPDWIVDNITFSVMLDPVVVSSYFLFL